MGVLPRIRRGFFCCVSGSGGLPGDVYLARGFPRFVKKAAGELGEVKFRGRECIGDEMGLLTE